MISSPKRSQIISERAPNYLFWIEIDSQHENVLNYFRNSLKLFLLNWNWFPVWILSHSVRPIYRRQRPPVNASTNIVLFGNNTSYKAATSIKTTTDKISIRYNTLAINQSCRNPIILQICGDIRNINSKNKPCRFVNFYWLAIIHTCNLHWLFGPCVKSLPV